MTDYTQVVSFGPKDALVTGTPNKKAKGTEIDAELSAISTAIASKVNKVSVPVENNFITQTSGGDGQDSGISSVNPGFLIDVEIFTASGTWTKPTGTTAVEVWVVGGGGGAAGITSAATGTRVAGGGAGATAGYARIITGLSSSETVTIGAGGAGGANQSVAGTNGGTSSFGTFVSCPGGGGSGATSAGGDTEFAGGSNLGAASFTGTDESLSVIGNAGDYGYSLTTNSPVNRTALGGTSGLGFGVKGPQRIQVPSGTRTGLDGLGHGCGGNGSCASGTSPTAVAGGSGSAGIVVVKSYR